MVKVFDKLKGRSLDELRVRSRQMIAAYRERHGWAEQTRMPSAAALFAKIDARQTHGVSLSAESLLEHFRTRSSPAFFASFAEQEKTCAALHHRFGPHAKEKVIERAARIIEGRFDLLGLRDLRFGDPINWHLEPVAGRVAPLAHWSRINYLDVEVAGDKKIIWELNRQQYFLTLGRAYWYTHDERYAETFVAHIDGWIDGNPPKMGINWASSLEVSFRAISWLWALYFFKDSPQVTPKVFLRILKLLYIHARHLETYLSTYFSPNTHLTGEALGLFYLGTLLPEFQIAPRWREIGKGILLAELDRHIKPDGVYFEQSSYYHRYTADFYTHLLILSRANGDPVEQPLEEKLTKLLDHLMYITRPDGTTPFFGDDDGGKLVMLDERAPNDFRAALSTGASLLARPDYKYVAGEVTEETLWLLGEHGVDAFDRLDAHPPAHTSQAFTDGGYYVMRDGWTREADYLLIDCGPHGTFNCGHAHADALAFELAAHGRTLLVDPGTYTYTGSAEMRDYFRSSAAHNTLTIDGESSSMPSGPFTWKHTAQSSVRSWISRERFDCFEGTHDGYARLAAPAEHTRRLLFLKGDYWIMRDSIVTTGMHRYDLHFHLAPDAVPHIETVDGITALRDRTPERTGLEMFSFGAGGEWAEQKGWVSQCYGERTPAPIGVFSTMAEGAQEFFTFLVPRRTEAAKAQVREIEAAGGRAFEVLDVLDKGRRDLLLAGDRHTVETAGIASDFAWSWLRLAHYQRTLKEMVLLGGHRLLFDGQEIFIAAEPVGYVAIRLMDDALIIDTDAKGSFSVAACDVKRVVLNNVSFPVDGEAVLNFDCGALRGSSVTHAPIETFV
ncbi:MAG: heparinase II/III family protein [Pyrinomonadaceae bacterium]|nr:heparinase II/III family protein [Pyrinomonadaceae bacterium]